MTAGIVSAHGRDIGSGPYDYMQIDAAVNHGNSGGPTFNLDGEVVGVNTAIYSPSGGNVGIAFAIPAKTATDVVEQLKIGGHGQPRLARRQDPEHRRGHGGEPRPERAQGRARHRGHRRTAPRPRPASRTATPSCPINGSKIADSRDLARQIADFSPNTKVDVQGLRGQKEQTVTVKLGKFPSGKELAKVESGKPDDPAEPTGDRAGSARPHASLPAPAPTRTASSITDVDTASDAAQKGIKSGDVILEVGGAAVKSPDDVANGIKKATQARPQGRAAPRQVGRSDALRRRPAQEELTLSSVSV